MTGSLNSSVAIISGGLGDIGRAIALELARRGANIAVGDILPGDQSGPLLAEIKKLGRQARYDRADVSDPNAVAEWVQAVETDLGVPQLIIPNAAIVAMADIRNVTPEGWSRELRINLDGAFHLARAGALRLLHHGQPGRIVFIGSWVAWTPQTHIPAYCVSKAGVRMLCKCMALELAPHGILVNEVAPGNVDAGLSAQIFNQFPERRARAMEQAPVGKLQRPEDVALQVAHLCDPTNDQMTGSVVLMDGGLSLLSTSR